MVLINSVFRKNILVATGIASIVFVFLSVISIFLSAENKVNFEIGLPWTFYYQFLVDCSIQHGTSAANFAKDIFFTWMLTTIVWFGLKRKR